MLCPYGETVFPTFPAGRSLLPAPPMALAVLVLLVLFVVLLALDVPVAFCIGTATLASLLVVADPGPAVSTVAQRLAGGLNSFTLLAIPFFILAGNLMAQGGIAQRLIAFARSLVGWMPGGLAFVNIIASMLFGAISGSAIAAAAAIGGVMHPKMTESGYDEGFSAAVNVSAATTGPHHPTVERAHRVLARVGRRERRGALRRGLHPRHPAWAVAHGRRGRGRQTARVRHRRARLDWRGRPKRFLDALPSLGLIVVVIGGIVGGIFTATEAAAIAVLYALILSVGVYRADVGARPRRRRPEVGRDDGRGDAARRDVDGALVGALVRPHPAGRRRGARRS